MNDLHQWLLDSESVWMAYKGLDFAQKRVPSPTLTLAVERIRARLPDSRTGEGHRRGPRDPG